MPCRHPSWAANAVLKEMEAQGLFTKQPASPLPDSGSQPQPEFTLGKDTLPAEEAPTLGEAQAAKEEAFTLGEEPKPRREFPDVKQPIKLTDVVEPEKTTHNNGESTLPDWAQERLKALGYTPEQIANTTDEQAAEAISQAIKERKKPKEVAAPQGTPRDIHALADEKQMPLPQGRCCFSLLGGSCPEP
jgi:hypothetical protein